MTSTVAIARRVEVTSTNDRKRMVGRAGALLLLGLATLAHADGQAACAAAAGTYLTGTVVAGPFYAHGKAVGGKQLSHTRLSLKADQDGRVYDVAIDNIYAAGYDQAGDRIPAPLDGIHRQDRLELCGQRYTSGLGIHWVHTNCGARPNRNHPDGWVKVLDAKGSAGPNLESSTEYCGLWKY